MAQTFSELANLKPASDRFKELNGEDADQFRKDLGAFLRIYDFLSQIIAYDPDIEKLYAFGKNLMPRIVEHGDSSLLELDADVLLTHFRLQKLGEQKLSLQGAEPTTLSPVTGAGSGATREDEDRALSEIVEKMNDLFAGGITEADFVGYATTLSGKLLKSVTLAEQAKNNTEEQFLMGDFKDVFTDAVLDSQEAHNNIAEQLLKDERIFAAMMGMLAKKVNRDFGARRT